MLTAAFADPRELHEAAAASHVDPAQERVVAAAVAHARAMGLVLPTFQICWVDTPSSHPLAFAQVFVPDPPRPPVMTFRSDLHMSPAALFQLALHESKHVADAALYRLGMPLAELERRADKFAAEAWIEARRQHALPAPTSDTTGAAMSQLDDHMRLVNALCATEGLSRTAAHQRVGSMGPAAVVAALARHGGGHNGTMVPTRLADPGAPPPLDRCLCGGWFMLTPGLGAYRACCWCHRPQKL